MKSLIETFFERLQNHLAIDKDYRVKWMFRLQEGFRRLTQIEFMKYYYWEVMDDYHWDVLTSKYYHKGER
jgi:hypothetical protein